MSHEKPLPNGLIHRESLYKKDSKEPIPESSRVTMVYGDGMYGRHQIYASSREFALEDCREFLTPESQRIARIAAGHVLHNVEHQAKIDTLGKALRSPTRDIMRDDSKPVVEQKRHAIGDTVIILGGFTVHGSPPESLAVFSEMLHAVPDMTRLRGVNIHLEGNNAPSVYKSFRFAHDVIDTHVAGNGSAIESVTLVCSQKSTRIFENIASRVGIPIHFVRNF